MKDYQSGAYFINRNGARRGSRRRRPRRAAGVLIAVLLLLTAGICFLVFFLPRLTATVTSSPKFEGKTFYMLATAQTDDRDQAILLASDASTRGGAGYVYNDGSYRIVAAVYEREADAKTLVSVNADSHYFALSVPAADVSENDIALLEYITGEWFTVVYTAATELDRGNTTDAAAEYAVANACAQLRRKAANASDFLADGVRQAAQFSVPQNSAVLAYIRYVQVSVIIAAHNALT